MPPSSANALQTAVPSSEESMTALGCRWIELPTFTDGRGMLAFVEGERHVPFDIRRIYYLYAVPRGQKRGEHGHRELQQCIVALSGSLDVTIDDGIQQGTFRLDSPARGLYVPKMRWRELTNFSPDAVCLVLASLPYDEGDYLRSYDAFLRARGL